MIKSITILTLFVLTINETIQCQSIDSDKSFQELIAQYRADENDLEDYALKNNIPLRYTENNIVHVLEEISSTGQAIYHSETNENSAATISTNKLYPGGDLGLNLTGAGITLRIWEAGGTPLISHTEFGNRITNGDSWTTDSSHATHVAGTMIAAGIDRDAKGMACEANMIAFQTGNMNSEMAIEAERGALISNHSYGTSSGWSGDSWFGNPLISTEEDYKFGYYNQTARSWDQIAHRNPNYLICKSAGNDRNDFGDGTYPPDGPYDCMPTYANAKNILTVGAINDLPNGYNGPESVTISSFSGYGPADDGRIKPDLVANGVSLYSSDNFSNTDYGFKNGTSMSAPSVSGSLALLQQHYHNLYDSYMKSSTLKALLIHTADEAGTSDGPDYSFGHGVANIASAANVISNSIDLQCINERQLSSGDSLVIEITAESSDPIKATIVWTDPEGTVPPIAVDPPNRILVNDLDLSITQDNNIHFPWTLDKDNPTAPASNQSRNEVDNIEVVFIESPIPGETYFVKISHTGPLLNDSQDFSLILSGCNFAPPLEDAPDLCETALNLNVRETCVASVFTGINLTASNVQPGFSCGDEGFGLDAWFTFIAPPTGIATVETVQISGGLTDLVIQSYTGDCNNLIPLACNDDSGEGAHSKLVFNDLIPDQIIYLRVINYAAIATSDLPFGICVYSIKNECIESTNIAVNESCMPSLFNNSDFEPSDILPGFDCGFTGAGNDGWYNIVVPESGNVSIETTQVTGGLTDMVMQAYSGTCDFLTVIGCNDDFNSGHAKVDLINRDPGEIIYIRIIEYSSDEIGDFGLCAYDLGETGNPMGNQCDNSISIEANQLCIETVVNNSTYTPSGILPSIECGNIGPEIDVWYTLEMPESERLVVETVQIAGGLLDMVLQAYIGECGNLQSIGCDDDGGISTHSRLIVENIAPGTTIYLRAIEYGSDDFGTFGICAYFNNGDITGDLCMDAEMLEVNNNCVSSTFSNVSLTASGIDPQFECNSPVQTIDMWFSALVPSSGGLTVETTQVPNGLTDMVIQAYSGDCDNLATIACNDDGGLGTHAMLTLNDLVPGETIYFRVIEYDSDEFGSFGICAFEPISALHELTGASINIYPNPARSFLKIDIEGYLEFEVKLYNLIGQEVISEKNISSINLNDIAQGTYIIKIFDLNSSNSISEKIIITK